MRLNKNMAYTHLKGNKVSRSELIQRKVIEIILKSKLPDKKRSWSKVFELKHSSSVIQVGRILAQKRRLKVDLAEVICALHDIAVNQTGKDTHHAEKSVAIAKKLLKQTKKFSASEIKLILKAIRQHSEKHIVSKDPYVELAKDADVFDCSLFEGVRQAYIDSKPRAICKTYFSRIKKIRKELGMPKDPQWDKLM